MSEFNLSPARLGLLLACQTLGAVIASPFAGFASARFGSRSLLRISAPASALTFAFIALAPSTRLFALALFSTGASSCFAGVAMNAQAVALEGSYRRTILSMMHGGFSIGMMVGALIAALVTHLGVSYQAHLLVVAALLLANGLAIGFFLIETDRPPRMRRGRVILSLPLVLIVAVAFLDFFCEGTASSWSSVYMHDSIGASSALAALTFGLFSLTMTLGRLFGDRLVLAIGVGAIVGVGGLIAACGIGLAVAIPMPLTVMIGFALFGFGLSCQAPILFRAAGQLPLPEGQGIVALMASMWVSTLLVAPVIGGLASITSLRGALLLTLGTAVAMVLLSRGLGRSAPTPLASAEPGQSR